VFASAGAGGTLRMLAHADVCDPGVPGREGCRFSPAYLQLQAGYLFDSRETFQHGAGLGIGSNLAPDGTTGEGIDPFGQWVLSPRYLFRLWLSDWFQVMAAVGVPLSFTAVSGNAARESFAFNWGAELQAGAVFKFLHGLGIYAAANAAMWVGSADSIWPTVSVEGGLVFDYEVLP